MPHHERYFLENGAPRFCRGQQTLPTRVQVEAGAGKGPRRGCACYAARQAAEWGLRYGVCRQEHVVECPAVSAD